MGGGGARLASTQMTFEVAVRIAIVEVSKYFVHAGTAELEEGKRSVVSGDEHVRVSVIVDVSQCWDAERAAACATHVDPVKGMGDPVKGIRIAVGDTGDFGLTPS